MNNNNDDDWIAYLGSMTCKNRRNGIIVEFTPCGKAYVGKIKDIPMNVFAKWAKLPDGELHVQKAVAEAEIVFLQTVFESENN